MRKRTWGIGFLLVASLVLMTGCGNSDEDKALLGKIDALEDRVNEAELELLWLHYCARESSHYHKINDEHELGYTIEFAQTCGWRRTLSEFEVGGKAHVRHDSEWGI